MGEIEGKITEAENPSSLGGKKVLKSGLKRKWKPRGDQFSKHIGRFIHESTSANGEAWEKRKEERQQKLALREVEEEMKQKRREQLKLRREKKRQKEEKKKENLVKSGGIQVIKNTSKIRKWNKKAKRQLIKMSPEMLETICQKKLF